VHMVERANKAKLGGRSNWTAGEIQASAWVSKNGETRLKQFGGDINAAMRSVSDVDSFVAKHIANVPYEAVPSAAGKHMPGMAQQPFNVRDAFTNDTRSSWLNSKTGHDKLYGDLAGSFQEPASPMIGAYRNPATGVTEFNPGFNAHPAVGLSKGGDFGKTPQISDLDQSQMRKIERLRGLLDSQDATTFNKVFREGVAPQPQKRDLNSIGVLTGPLTRPQIQASHKIAADLGFNTESAFPVQMNDQLVLVDFGTDPKTLALKRDRFKTEMGKIGVKVDAERAHFSSALLDSGLSANTGAARPFVPEGTSTYTKGDVVRNFFKELDDDALTPNLAGRMNNSEVVRKAASDRIRRDIQYAKQTGEPLDPAVMKVYVTLAQPDGIEKLRKIRQTAPWTLPAMLLPILDDAIDAESRQRRPE